MDTQVNDLLKQFLDSKSFQVPDYVPVSVDPPPVYDKGDVALDIIEKTLNSEEGQRSLQAEIQKLGDSAQAVEIAFRSVSRGLDKAITTATARGQTSELRKFKGLWDGHHKKYVELVWESRRVAGHARTIATDFAGDFLDVIKDQTYTVEEKKQEIAAYREELEKDIKESQKLSQGFIELHAAVVAFKVDLQNYIDQYIKDKEAKINKLIDDIEKMQESLQRSGYIAIAMTIVGLGFGAVAGGAFALGCICPPLLLLSAGSLAVGAGMAGYGWYKYRELSNKEDQLKKELEDHQRHLEGMNKIKTIVASLRKDMDLIEDKLQIFAQIWSFIHSDLNAIEKELGLASNAATKRRFEQKIKAVSVTYKTLATALRLYETNVHIRHSEE